MDNKYIEELKKKLESGDITQELYDEISKRWNNSNSIELPEEANEEDTNSRRTGTTRVSGSGRFSNVTSEYFKVSGACNVEGFVDVENMTVSGSAKIEGPLKVIDILEASGSLKADLTIEVGTLDASGSVRAGEIKAKIIESSGSLKAERGIEAETMDIAGSCSAETISSETLECSGMLSALTVRGKSIVISGGIKTDSVECETFEMQIEGSPHRKGIGKLKADEVNIRSRKRFLRGNASIEIDEIDCKNAYLESVHARRVTGDEVIVGDNSVIDYVEAKVVKTTGNAEIHEKKIK